jgi:hypothetical protein
LRSTKASVLVGKESFRVYETGTLKLTYVDGALPWIAKVGDRFRYADLIAPPRMFGVESNGQEIEYFVGEYIEPNVVWEAFEKPGKPPRRVSVHGAQPFRRSAFSQSWIRVGTLFAIINLVLLVWSFANSGRIVAAETFTAPQYQAESFSKPFKIEDGNIIAVKVNAGVRNAWLYTQFAFVNSNDEVVTEGDAEVSYYYGSSGGESWSEGSQSTTTYLKAPNPGTYKLVIRGEGGSGINGPDTNKLVKIEIRQGAVLSRYFVMLFIFSAIVPLFGFIRKILFEGRRWSEVTEDDDD